MTDDPDLDAAYALDGPEDNRRLYKQWASTYDQEFAQALGYDLPRHVAKGFVDAGGKGPVIDLGAGTGLCGEALAALGIGPLEAADLSQDMLDVANSKNIYARSFTGNLLERLPVDSASYAGAVSSGTFTHGHVGPEALTEVVRILRPGGLAVLSVNAEHWQAKGFADVLSKLPVHSLTLKQVRIYNTASKDAHSEDTGQIVTFTRQ